MAKSGAKHLRMTRRVLKKVTRCFSWRMLPKTVPCGVTVGLVFLALIPWFGSTWQLVTGSSVTTHGVLLNIPARYLLTGNRESEILMWRFDFGVPVWNAPQGLIEISHNANLPELNTEQILMRSRVLVAAERQSTGLPLVSRRVIATRVGRAACFEFGRLNMATVNCFFPGELRISARYDGDAKFVPDVYEVVKSARPAPSPGD